MAADFKLVGNPDTIRAVIASATEIEAGDLVSQTNGLIVKGVAASTTLAYAMEASAVGDTEIEITKGKVELIGTANVVFADAYRGDVCDLVGTTTQLIDIATSSTNVFRVASSTDTGVVGSADDVRVFIDKPITY